MMDVEIVKNSEDDATIQTHQCPNCSEAQISELDLRNHLLSCLKSEETIIEINDDDENGSRETLLCPSVTKIGEKNFECDNCGQIYTTKPRAVSHFKRVHLGMTFKCHLCEKDLSRKEKLELHLKRVHATMKPFECNVCGKIFSQSDKLRDHENKRHKSKVTNIFECDICQKKLTSSDYLKNHVQRIHDKVRHFKCDSCEKAFFSKAGLLEHLDAVHRGMKKMVECKYCNKEMGESYLKKHIDIIHFKIKHFKCKLCSKTFGQKNNLKRHEDTTHSGIKLKTKNIKSTRKHPCSLCDMTFSTSAVLRRHVDVIHLLKKHSCEICNKTFCTIDKVKLHVKTEHFSENNFFCGFCGKSFTIKGDLARHENKVHFKKKPTNSEQNGICSKERGKINCTFCDKTLRGASINRHLREVHNQMDENIKCDTCDIDFPSKYKFREHMRSHQSNQNEPVVCEKCGKTFNSKRNLSSHKFRVHPKAS